MLGLSFSSKLDRGCYIVSVPKSASKKIEALMRSIKFPSSEIALYLYKSTRWACMEYCCHVWASTSSCYLELWDQLQKQIRMKVGPSLAVCPQPLARRQNVSSLSLSVGIALLDVHLNWLNLFHFLILEGGLLVILIDGITFLSPFLDVTKMSMSIVSFLTQSDPGILCL